MEPTVPDGYKVRYRHVRRIKSATFHDSLFVPPQVDPLGGTTIATLYKDEIESARGVARCHDRDNYNKKIGRRIALGRAIKDLNSSPPRLASAVVKDPDLPFGAVARASQEAALTEKMGIIEAVRRRFA